MTRSQLAVLALAGLALAGCTVSPTPPPPRPVSPFPATVAIAAVTSPADLVLADGRRLHVPRLQGSPPAGNGCYADADVVLARTLTQGAAFSMTAPRVTDSPGAVPAGSLQGDLAGAGGVDYADTFYGQQWDHRVQQCPTPTPEPVTAPTETSEPSDGGDTVIVRGGDDDHHESRFCRRRIWC
jgi:hypothetical protein